MSQNATCARTLRLVVGVPVGPAGAGAAACSAQSTAVTSQSRKIDDEVLREEVRSEARPGIAEGRQPGSGRSLLGPGDHGVPRVPAGPCSVTGLGGRADGAPRPSGIPSQANEAAPALPREGQVSGDRECRGVAGECDRGFEGRSGLFWAAVGRMSRLWSAPGRAPAACSFPRRLTQRRGGCCPGSVCDCAGFPLFRGAASRRVPTDSGRAHGGGSRRRGEPARKGVYARATGSGPDFAAPATAPSHILARLGSSAAVVSPRNGPACRLGEHLLPKSYNKFPATAGWAAMAAGGIPRRRRRHRRRRRRRRRLPAGRRLRLR